MSKGQPNQDNVTAKVKLSRHDTPLSPMISVMARCYWRRHPY